MNSIFSWMSESGVTLFGVIGWICVGVVAYMNIRWRIKNLEDSHALLRGDHQAIVRVVEKQIDVTRTVELNAARLVEIAKASERRLQLVEDRLK